MKAASLFGVFFLAKILVLCDRSLPHSAWMPVAYLWQDLFAVLAFAAVDLALRRRWPAWVLYWAAALYAAVNVPIERLLSTPITLPVLRAARGTLADSITHHVTWQNLLLIGLVLAAAGLLPFLMRRVPARALRIAAAAAVPVILLGPHASSRVDTMGLDRNPVIAIVESAFPRVGRGGGPRDWRESPMDQAPRIDERTDDLSRWRGSAAGRNVLLVMLESAGASYLGIHGAAEDPMPHLTELAREAIVFEAAYAVYPESIKGLFSVLRSLYPAFDTPAKAHGEVKIPSIASVLSQAGYRNGLFHSGRFMYLGMDAIVRSLGFETLEDAGHIGGNHDSSFGVDEPSAVRRILAWLGGLPRDQRFFAVYLPIAGHHPYETPAGGPFSEREEIGRYRNALHYCDDAVKQLLDGLRTRGLSEKTLIVLAGDHGEAFHQHEGNYGHTFFIHEENVRVPYLIVAPGLFRERTRVSLPASLIDTTPTILDFLGIAPPAEFQGSSLLEGRPRMAMFFTDYSLGFLGLRDGPWKFIHEMRSGRSKLFDLREDPDERRDLSEREPTRAEAYRARLLEWCAFQREHVRRLAGGEGGAPVQAGR